MVELRAQRKQWKQIKINKDMAGTILSLDWVQVAKEVNIGKYINKQLSKKVTHVIKKITQYFNMWQGW